VKTEINATKVELENGIGEVKTEINATKEKIQTQIDALDEKIDSVIASLEMSTASSTTDGGDGTQTGRRARQLQPIQLQPTATKDTIGTVIGSSLGLTVDVQCPPPRKGSGKSTKGKKKQLRLTSWSIRRSTERIAREM